MGERYNISSQTILNEQMSEALDTFRRYTPQGIADSLVNVCSEGNQECISEEETVNVSEESMEEALETFKKYSPQGIADSLVETKVCEKVTVAQESIDDALETFRKYSPQGLADAIISGK